MNAKTNMGVRFSRKGLVDFVPLDRVWSHLKALIPSFGSRATARFEAFTSAFQPAHIMERAQLPALFQKLSLLRMRECDLARVETVPCTLVAAAGTAAGRANLTGDL